MGDCRNFMLMICIWLSLPSLTLLIYFVFCDHDNKPHCYIEDFYVPALNTHKNSTANINFIFFDLKLENVLDKYGVRYDTVNLTFSYGQNPSSPIAEYAVPPFYQGHHKTAHRTDVVVTHGMKWDDALAAVSNGSKVVFRVNLATKVKFKSSFYLRDSLMVGAYVEVDGTGNKVGRKAVKLKPGGGRPKRLTEKADGSLVSSF